MLLFFLLEFCYCCCCSSILVGVGSFRTQFLCFPLLVFIVANDEYSRRYFFCATQSSHIPRTKWISMLCFTFFDRLVKIAIFYATSWDLAIRIAFCVVYRSYAFKPKTPTRRKKSFRWNRQIDAFQVFSTITQSGSHCDRLKQRKWKRVGERWRKDVDGVHVLAICVFFYTETIYKKWFRSEKSTIYTQLLWSYEANEERTNNKKEEKRNIPVIGTRIGNMLCSSICAA